ncbi:hypothetical protein [Ideonella sp. A 288]|uniref:hypothetical protein n=1 Tax=Ideonella sp. A 288 TaxID=1962181 RepID=UPI000B4AA28C|nr:hypothetical protein [Ideonella sp. A 288]
MRREISKWFAITLSGVVLAACGGGEPGPAASSAFVATIATTPADTVQQRTLAVATARPAKGPAARLTALVAGTRVADTRRTALALGPNDPVDATAALDWAEWQYPDLFPKGPANVTLDYLGVRYTVRTYRNGNNLGITSAGGIYGLGVFTNQQLVSFGIIANYESLVRADRCSVYPGSCDIGGGTTLNECQPLSTTSLVTGTRVRAEYEFTGLTSGTQVMDSRVDGPTTYNGQSAVQISSTLTGNLTGIGTLTSSDRSFVQAADGGLVRTLGDEGTATLNGLVTAASRSVYDPPVLNKEFTLARGGVLTQTVSGTTTPTQPAGPATRFSSTTVYTFVARESISVLGKTYDTCRYVERAEGSQASTTSWYHVGTGIPVRINDSAGEASADLRTATVNGVPI